MNLRACRAARKNNGGLCPRPVAALVITLCALLGFAAPARASSAADSCARLGHGTRMGSSTILLAEYESSGSVTAIDGSKQTGLGPFCRLIAVATPRPSSRVLIEVWLPAEADWNGKILGTGNGGAAGQISAGSLAGGLKRGFAVANTDMGTYPGGMMSIGFSFGNGRPEAIRDWAYRSTHEMTVFVKEAVRRYYSRQARRAYFVGCSTGGHEALMEAQRYPEDYDGIIVGAPAHNRTHLHVRFAMLQKLGSEPAAVFAPGHMKLWTDQEIKSCAGRDGGAPGDRFLTQPLLCKIRPSDMECGPGRTAPCLAKGEVDALDRIYDGTRNPRTGELIYYADVRGAEEQLMMVYGNGFFSRNFDITHWVLPPDRPSSSFDFDRDMAALDTRYPDVNAMNPDLSRFAARGGKIIFFHGWQDGLISPLDTVDYYKRMSAKGHRKSDFSRLYMVPGMGHCAGGPGPSAFGQAAEIRNGATPGDDLLVALDRWSEGGTAPGPIVGAHYEGLGVLLTPGAPPVPASTRPLCPFPEVATYDGRGDVKKAASFVCVAAAPPAFARPAAKYLH